MAVKFQYLNISLLFSCSKDMDFTVAKPVKIYNITQNLVYH